MRCWGLRNGVLETTKVFRSLNYYAPQPKRIYLKLNIILSSIVMNYTEVLNFKKKKKMWAWQEQFTGHYFYSYHKNASPELPLEST
jgi:hypothetical protein